jgi:NTP pyrophosphatase (non-canonical NTP hydrolase)
MSSDAPTTVPVPGRSSQSTSAIEYYNKKFGDNTQAAFVHLVREIGEIAFAIEKQNIEHAKLEITESIALLYYLASKYNFDASENMQALYSKKLQSLKTA